MVTFDYSTITETTAPRLIASPPEAPFDWETIVTRRAIRLASSRLDLPPRVRIQWHRHPEPDVCDGATELRSGAITMHLGVTPSGVHPDLGRDSLAQTVLHECRHVADFHAGRAFDRPAWERDADSFALEMLPHFRAGTVPDPEAEDDDDPEDEDDGSEERGAVTERPAPLPSRDCQARDLAREMYIRLRRIVPRVEDGDIARALRVIAVQADTLDRLLRR